MKFKTSFLLFLLIVLTGAVSIAQVNAIRINQLGYYPGSNKIAIVTFCPATQFELVRLSDSVVVFSGNLSSSVYWSDAADSVKKADFSTFTETGKYFLRIPGFGSSYPFEISNSILRKAAYASLKSFYYQRSSYPLLPEFAGLWSRNAGHPDTLCLLHSSTGKTGSISSPGGWYDAGDYGKYVINAGISVASLLSFHENFDSFFQDGSIHIPESGNGINDLLDETKFELDWLKTMQDSDGGVFFKLTTLAFSGFVMPEADKAARYVIGKSTSSALDFAAMMAMAGRVYKSYDSIWSADCISRADSAWKWALAHPAIYFKNPADVSTGEYGDNNVTDEFIWAAAELFITTGKDEYKTYLESRSSSLNYSNAPGWSSVQPLASLSLVSRPNGLSATILTNIKNSLISTCDKWLGQISSSPCRIPQFGYNWGSNSQIANMGVAMIYAWKVTGDLKYVRGAGECADYLLGKNATGFSFESGYGSKTPMNFHHRPSASDGIAQPVPGFISGGPNSGKEDGQIYPFTQPAKCYVDVTGSYASNEVCINWNSPFTALLAGVDAILGDSSMVDFEVPVQANNPPSLSISSPPAKTGNDLPLTVKCTATDPDGMNAVEIYIDARFICSINASPFNYTLDTLAAGNHSLTAIATDQKGLATEKSVNFFYFVVHQLPNKVEAEYFSTNSGASVQSTIDAGGGQNITSLDPNDYVDYTVIVPETGKYRVDFRVASTLGTGQFQLKNLTSTIFTTLSVPKTGGTQTWTTLSDTINLNAGKQTLRLVVLAGGWNLNWMNFQQVIETGVIPPEKQEDAFLRVAPNPVFETAVLSFRMKFQDPPEFRLINMKGQIVWTKMMDQSSDLIGSFSLKELENLNPGVYTLMMLQQKQMVASLHMIKAR